MEFPELGDHCRLTDCKQLDFLPFRCDFCRFTFCLNHRMPLTHACDKYVESERTALPSSLGQPISFTCEFSQGCDSKDLTSVLCPKCQLKFCLKHRHPPDHRCSVWEREQRDLDPGKRAAPAQVTFRQRPLRNDKARQMAAKVALMKIKLHAKGDDSIPQTERVYFRLVLPRTGFKETEVVSPDNLAKDEATFLSSKWSLGRAIDFLAERYKLRNANNVASARKLRLFRREDGARLSNTSRTLEEIVNENVVFSGSPLILEYVDAGDDEGICLDPSLYPS